MISQSEDEDVYLTIADVYNGFISRSNSQTIYGTKTFNSNVNATEFVKTGQDDTSVLQADGCDRILSSFGGIEDLTSSVYSGAYNAGTFNCDYLVQDNVAVITYIPFPNHTVDKGGYVSITHSTGLNALRSTFNIYIQCASATWFK
ncbi:MAG: hypothetical protein EZS28_009764 [Streblomastix strix]|uniref:Uncharacterized protein n=1 Tax=Streblomastix strix TaxID=222440 RepID=A0A5J4WI81_9EUKA|nr:MAG: hypothetical protein EZS28_009764 [Streblomastix strix]